MGKWDELAAKVDREEAARARSAQAARPVLDRALDRVRARVEEMGRDIARVLNDRQVPTRPLPTAPGEPVVSGWRVELDYPGSRTSLDFWELTAGGLWRYEPGQVGLSVADDELGLWNKVTGKPMVPLKVQGLPRLLLDEALEPRVGTTTANVPLEDAAEQSVRLLLLTNRRGRV